MDEMDTTVAHSARIWNYWLGGKDHFPVDRGVGDQIARGSRIASVWPALTARS